MKKSDETLLVFDKRREVAKEKIPKLSETKTHGFQPPALVILHVTIRNTIEIQKVVQ